MTQAVRSGVDEVLSQAVDSGAVPGVVAIVTGRDDLIYEGSAGLLSVDNGAPAGADTMFAIASMTKALTSVAALQLVEQGRLALDQTVASVIPAFGDLQVLDGFDGDTPRLREPASQATIGQLLTHTSGLAYWFSHPDLLRYHELTGTPTPLEGKLACLDAPLLHDPGTHWEYGTNTDWLGRVVETVSGARLDAHLAEHVFAPLGMADATFAPSKEQAARMMALHARTPDGGLALSDIAFPEEPEFMAGGHGANATARDYARFLRAMLAGGQIDGAQVLRPETVEMAFSDHLDEIALPEVMRSAIPELSNDVPSLPVAQGWGLGFHLVHEDLEGMRTAGTGDWAGIFNCYYWIDRSAGIAAAIFTQVLPFFDEQIVEMLQAFELAVYAEAGSR